VDKEVDKGVTIKLLNSSRNIECRGCQSEGVLAGGGKRKRRRSTGASFFKLDTRVRFPSPAGFEPVDR